MMYENLQRILNNDLFFSPSIRKITLIKENKHLTIA